MANSLYPAFFRLFYHTAFGQHIQTVPTRAWDDGLGTNGKGGYIAWDTNEVDAVDMVQALVDELVEFQPASAVYDSCIIYTMASETAEPLPVASFELGDAGTAATADVPASQATMSCRTTNFGLFKLTWFDAAPTTDFLPQRTLPVSGQPLTLFQAVSDTDWAFAGRDGGRPETFLQVSYTLNEALRRQYRLN